jgi:acetoacetate decarboxylase
MPFPPSANYPAPPWTYTRARVLNVACRAQHREALYRWLPDSLVPVHGDGTFVLWFAHVPSIPELGAEYTSTECGIVIPVRTRVGGHVGSTFALMIVDNDMALAGGREIWGYPKKLGSLSFGEDGGEGNVVAEARHRPYRVASEPVIASVRARMDGAGEDVTELVASLEPRYLERVVPSPYGAEAQSREVLRVAHRDARVHLEKKCGSAEVAFGATAERFNEFGRIEARGAIFRVVDFVLPHALRVEQGT